MVPMKIHRSALVVGGELLLMLLSVTMAGISAELDTTAVRIEILYTQNTNGVLENCDCPGTPLGGLDKRMALMKRLADKASVPALYLDGGDILSAKGFPAKDRFILRAYALMGYDAIGMGDQEFSNGTQFLNDVNLHLRLPFISASIVADDDVMKPLAQTMVKTIVGVRFGLISIIGKDPFEYMDSAKIRGVKISDYRENLPFLIRTLRAKTDVVILLSHLGHSEDIALAKKYRGIDIIIGAHSQNVLSTPLRYGTTIVLQAGKNTEFVGQLTLLIDKKSKTIKDAKGALHPVLKDVPGEPRLQQLISGYQKAVASDFKESPWPVIPLLAPEFIVVENERCAQCHPREVDTWQKTKHARAFQSVFKRFAATRSECIPCHTTGFGRTDGNAPTIASEGGGVGCVECHGVTSEHLRIGKGGMAAMTENTCVRCHVPEIDPLFQFATSLVLINHGTVEEQEYIVQQGDNLSKIALQRYSNARHWRRIYAANKTRIKNPNLIFPRQALRLRSQ